MTEPTINPFLTKIRLPGKRIRLPSGGMIYQNGELDQSVTNGEIEIFPLTAIDDIILSSPDRMLNGEGIVDVFKRIAPAVNKPLDLFSQDFEEIMVHNHIVTHGTAYNVRYSHSCNDEPHEYNIDCAPFINNSVVLDPSTAETRFSYRIETQEGVFQEIVLRPRRVKHIINLATAVRDADVDYEKFQMSLLEGLLNSIHSIDGIVITDSTMKQAIEWVKCLRSTWIEDLTKKLDDVDSWGPMMTSHSVCKACGDKMDIPVTLNPISFFL